MKSYAIKQAEFITSIGAGQTPPAPLCAEIAIVGRSNVGKSSLMNALCHNGKLARTSATPGKTRLINYFKLNREFYLVDLPGYGFAKASKSERESWSELIGDYLSSGRVSHILLLLDIRHAPTEEDRMMFRWVLYYGVPFTLVATKADKLSRAQRQVSAVNVARQLGAPPAAIAFSAESGDGMEALTERIGEIVADAQKLAGKDS